MKAYVAGASSEIERVENVIKQLRDAGITITCTWPEEVRKVGHANPPEASHAQRGSWAKQDLREVDQANALLICLPGKGHSTSGAWTELGFAYAKDKLIIMAGEHHSVFTGLADHHYKRDDHAVEHLIWLSKLTDGQSTPPQLRSQR